MQTGLRTTALSKYADKLIDFLVENFLSIPACIGFLCKGPKCAIFCATLSVVYGWVPVSKLLLKIESKHLESFYSNQSNFMSNESNTHKKIELTFFMSFLLIFAFYFF